MRTYKDFPGVHSEPCISVFLWMQPLVHFQGDTSGSDGLLLERPLTSFSLGLTSFSCCLQLMFQACVTQRENNAGISPNQLK